MVAAALAALGILAVAPRDWEYHYDRNALVASARVGASLIAIAEAGHVLRFDLATLQLTGERLSARRVVVLGAATESDVLVGFSNGAIARLDVGTLTATPVATVEGHPLWIASCPDIAGPVVVYASDVAAPYPYRPRGLVSYRVRLLGTNEELGIDPGSTFLCDSRGRLWIGEDRGEWGGTVQVVDLRTRPLTARSVPLENGELNGIYGLAESAKGQIVGFGGMLHMGFGDAYVASLSPALSSRIRYSTRSLKRPQAGKRSPRFPITQLLPVKDGWMALSYDAVFKCDRAFAKWERLTELKVRTNPGRPDAVGSYPGIVAAVNTGGRILLTTRRDGLLELRGRTLISHALARQLDVAPDSLAVWADGMAARDSDGHLSVQVNGRWQAPFEDLPRLRKNPALQPDGHGSYLPLPDGRVLVVATAERDWDSVASVEGEGMRYRPVPFFNTFLEPGNVATDAGEQQASLNAPSFDNTFLLPAGTPAMSGPDETVWVFADGKWVHREPPLALRPVSKWVAKKGSRSLGLTKADFFHDDQLFWIDAGSTSSTEPIALPARLDGHKIVIEDAIAWDSQHVLAATESGFCLLEIENGNCVPFDRGREVEAGRIVRDAHHRPWIAGRGLWRLDEARGPVPHPLDLPFLQDTDVVGLEAIGDRLVLALRGRGIAVLATDPARPEFDEPILDRWNTQKPHEPRFDDGAVLIYLEVEPRSDQPSVKRFFEFGRRLRLEIRTSGIRAYDAWEPDLAPGYRTLFHTSDVDGLARLASRLAQADAVGPHLRVMIRRGPRGRAREFRWKRE